MPGVLGIYDAAALGLQPVPRRSTPASPRRCWPATASATSASPSPPSSPRRASQAVDAADAVIVDYDLLEVYVDPEVALDRDDAAVRRRRQQRRVRLDGARHARPDRRRVLRRLRGHGLGHVHQPARRPLPARGAQLGRGLDRRPVDPVDLDPARPGRQGPDRRRQRHRRRPGPHHHPRRRRRLRRQDQHVPRGDGARSGGQARRPARALAGDAQRVDDGARPRPGPGPARHDRRQPRRQGHALPPARHRRRRGVLRHGRHPRPVHDPPDVLGRLRHPAHRVPHDVRGHQHHADHGLPRRRAARGHGGHRAGDGHVRPRARARPRRRPPHEPHRPVRASRTPP